MNATSGDTTDPKTASFVVSYAITTVLSSLIVIAKESNEGFHDWMASITGHHWITHGIFDVIVFIVLGMLLAKVASVASMSGSGMIKKHSSGLPY